MARKTDIDIAGGYPALGKLESVFEVPAKAVGETLAVNKGIDVDDEGEVIFRSTWNVTHLPTGWALVRGLPSQAAAKAAASILEATGFEQITTEDPTQAGNKAAALGLREIKQWIAEQMASSRTAATLTAKLQEEARRRQRKERPAAAAKRAAPARRKHPTEPDLLTLARKARKNPEAALIDVRTADGIYEVDGERFGQTIAINKELKTEGGETVYGSRWNVTHIPSGCAFQQKVAKSIARALAQALVDMGYDGVASGETCESASEELRRSGAYDLFRFYRTVEAQPAKQRLAAIDSYVAHRLHGAPPSFGGLGPKRVPAARKRGKKPTSAPKAGRAPAQSAPVEVDLIALARRARGNPVAGGFQRRSLW